jgi:CheY-like chemotaxis protein
MNKHTILIIDDERMTHMVIKALLEKEYNLLLAENAQDGINLLAENVVNLVLLDIQMPELSGLELLESLMQDTVLKNVPVIIMTGFASDEVKNKAKELGAADFVDKSLIISDKDQFLSRVEMNLITTVETADLSPDLKMMSMEIARIFKTESVDGDFFSTSRKLGNALINSFNINYLSFWAVNQGNPNMLLSLGKAQPENFGPEEIRSERAFLEIAKTKRPYLTNNASSAKRGIFANTAMEFGLTAEIGVPLFALTEQMLIKNNMQIPSNTPMFGIVIIKRNRVFTTKEFKMISRLLMQAGTILWRLYKALLGKQTAQPDPPKQRRAPLFDLF